MPGENPFEVVTPEMEAAAAEYYATLAPPAWFYPLVGEVASQAVLMELCMTEAALLLTESTKNPRDVIAASHQIIAAMDSVPQGRSHPFDLLRPAFEVARNELNAIVHALYSGMTLKVRGEISGCSTTLARGRNLLTARRGASGDDRCAAAHQGRDRAGLRLDHHPARSRRCVVNLRDLWSFARRDGLIAAGQVLDVPPSDRSGSHRSPPAQCWPAHRRSRGGSSVVAGGLPHRAGQADDPERLVYGWAHGTELSGCQPVPGDVPNPLFEHRSRRGFRPGLRLVDHRRLGLRGTPPGARQPLLRQASGPRHPRARPKGLPRA